MRQRIVVEVDEGDIRCGKHRSARECPIALAACRATGKEAMVAADHLSFAPDHRYAVRLPIAAQAFLDDFEAGRKVRPFAFECAYPGP